MLLPIGMKLNLLITIGLIPSPEPLREKKFGSRVYPPLQAGLQVGVGLTEASVFKNQCH
jgi:hypothetical protein